MNKPHSTTGAPRGGRHFWTDNLQAKYAAQYVFMKSHMVVHLHWRMRKARLKRRGPKLASHVKTLCSDWSGRELASKDLGRQGK